MFEYSSMENLLPDIILDIFSRLPAESILKCKQVCKTWHTLLRRRSKFFARIHLRRQLLQLDDQNGCAAKVGVGLLFSIRLEGEKGIGLYYDEQYHEININDDKQYPSYKTLKRIDHPPIDEQPGLDFVVGSCNGLICLVKHHHSVDDPIHICNPMTREYVYLPRFIISKRNLSRIMASGFGCLRSTNEYKVVRIYYPHSDSKGWVQVYTLGSGCGWRNKGEISYSLGFQRALGVFANGAIYWIVQKEWKIVAFDLEDEEFRVLPSPPCFHPAEHTRFALQVLGGHLCLVHQETGKSLNIWLLEKNSFHGAKDQEYRWNKEFSIPWEGPIHDAFFYVPLTVTKSNRVLLAHTWGSLFGYDPETANFKLLWEDDDYDLVQAIPHMNSFVSLRALGEKSKKRRRCQDNLVSLRSTRARA